MARKGREGPEGIPKELQALRIKEFDNIRKEWPNHNIEIQLIEDSLIEMERWPRCKKTSRRHIEKESCKA